MHRKGPFLRISFGTERLRKGAVSGQCTKACGSMSEHHSRSGKRKRLSRMSDGPRRPSIFTIPSHRSFADALAAGLIQRFGKDPFGLARGRILLPNNRAVRAVTDAFVRASANGLLLPRLIPIGDPELDERISGALDGI